MHNTIKLKPLKSCINCILLVFFIALTNQQYCMDILELDTRRQELPREVRFDLKINSELSQLRNAIKEKKLKKIDDTLFDNTSMPTYNDCVTIAVRQFNVALASFAHVKRNIKRKDKKVSIIIDDETLVDSEAFELSYLSRASFDFLEKSQQLNFVGDLIQMVCTMSKKDRSIGNILRLWATKQGALPPGYDDFFDLYYKKQLFPELKKMAAANQNDCCGCTIL